MDEDEKVWMCDEMEAMQRGVDEGRGGTKEVAITGALLPAVNSHMPCHTQNKVRLTDPF